MQTSCYGVHRVRKVPGGNIESGEGKAACNARSLLRQGLQSARSLVHVESKSGIHKVLLAESEAHALAVGAFRLFFELLG